MNAQSLAEKYIGAGTVLPNETVDQMESDINSRASSRTASGSRRLHGLGHT